jgi:hypothetical protein
LFVTDFGLALLAAVGFQWVLERIGRASAPTRGGGRRALAALVVSGVVVAFTALQLGIYGRHENPPFAAGSTVFPSTPLIRALLADDGGGWPHRILPLRLDSAHPPMLYAGESVVFGIDSAGGYDSVVPPRTVELWQVAEGRAPQAVVEQKSPQDFVPTWEVATTRLDLLPRLGIDRIVATPDIVGLDQKGWRPTYQGKDGVIFTWTGATVGPHVVGQATVVNGDLAAMRAFVDPHFDDRTSVVLERGGSYRGGGGGRVESASRGVNTASLTVTSAGGYLVIPDMWDSGWSATVNGRATPVLRANFNQQAVQVPPGTVRVHLRYRPPGFRSGLVVSVLALVGLAALMAPGRTRRRREALPEGVPESPSMTEVLSRSGS